MKNGLHMIATFAAFAVLLSLVAGNECDCHVCPSVAAQITPIPTVASVSIGGVDSYTGTGIVDGSSFSLSSVVWLEGGTGPNVGVGAAFYSNGLDLSDHDLAPSIPPSDIVTDITLAPSVAPAMANGCFCPHAGMTEYLSSQTLGTQTLTFLTNTTSLEFACGAGTSKTTFRVDATGLTQWISSESGPSPSEGFGHIGTGAFELETDAALFGAICSQCPTPEPTDSPTESPTESPTDVPSESPTESPTSGPSLSPTSGPTVPPVDESDPAFFEVQNNIYMVAGAGGGFLLLLLLLVLVRSRKKTKTTQVLSALPADVEDPETKPRKARGNAPDPNNSQSIRLEIDDEIFDWEKHIDKASGEVYFFNPKTGESRWEPPTIKKKT